MTTHATLLATAGVLAATGLALKAAQHRRATAPLYLDAQATTPLHPAARRALEETGWANPGSPHAPGQAARQAVENARAEVSRLLGDPRQVCFTSGATEALNLALQGSIHHLVLTGAPPPLHVLTTPIEHKAVLQPLQHLQERGLVELGQLPLTPAGVLLPEALAHALRPTTALVAIGWANNEIGTIQPLEDLAAVLEGHPARLIIDATQLAGLNPSLPARADAAAVSAHKLYGPKGIGALLLREGLELEPLTFGGGQEGGLRPRTQPAPLIVGFGVAARLARTLGHQRAARLRRMASLLLGKLPPGIQLNGPTSPEERLPGNLSLTLPPGLTVPQLRDAIPHIAFSQGSACSCSKRGSHVLAALGLPLEDQQRTLRLGFHALLTDDDALRAIQDVAAALARLMTGQG